MDQQALKGEIQALIAANKIDEAIERLAGAQFSALDKELIILNSQYNRVKEELRLNLISKDEGERRMNGITMALINLSDKIGAESSVLPDQILGKSRSKQQLALLILIPVVLIAGLVYWMSSSKAAKTADTETTTDSSLTTDTTGLPANSLAPVTEKSPEDKVDPTLPPSLVAAFLFNNNANDAIGDHHGYISNAVPAEDRKRNKDRAIYFNGTDAHIQLPEILEASSVNFSIACWIKSEKSGGAIFGQFTNKIDQDAYTAANHFVALVNGYPGLDEYPPTNTDFMDPFQAAKRLQPNQWVHLVFVRNGAIAKWYINGTLVNQGTMLKQYSLPGHEPSYALIGARPNGTYSSGVFKPNSSFKGAIDDLYIFDAAIDEATVKKLYSAE